LCEFCIQHGEGKKWYLTMHNYSRELWAEQGREDFIDRFIAHFEEKARKEALRLEAVRDIPIVYPLVRRGVIRKQKAEHWGQVVPIEDIEKIIDLQDSIVRLPCPCRKITTGRETRYCFGIGVDPTGILGKYPDYSHSLEVLEREEAKKILGSFDKQGLVHSVWTFKTPYIGAICNCDQDCLAYRVQVTAGLVQIMFRAEYVGVVDWDACNGCKKCILHCQFGAIRYSNTMNRVTIDTMRCYGCGVCRAVCEKQAIALKPRIDFAKVPW